MVDYPCNFANTIEAALLSCGVNDAVIDHLLRDAFPPVWLFPLHCPEHPP